MKDKIYLDSNNRLRTIIRVCIMRSNAHPLKILILNLLALDQGYLYLPLLEKD